MRTRTALFIIACLLVSVAGCTQKQKQEWSHWKSDIIGLDRTVTLYATDGKKIREWKGRFKVENNGSTARFIADGKAVIISGTYVVEEK